METVYVAPGVSGARGINTIASRALRTPSHTLGIDVVRFIEDIVLQRGHALPKGMGCDAGCQVTGIDLQNDGQFAWRGIARTGRQSDR